MEKKGAKYTTRMIRYKRFPNFVQGSKSLNFPKIFRKISLKNLLIPRPSGLNLLFFTSVLISYFLPIQNAYTTIPNIEFHYKML